jgi:DNA-binding beta-propeller fold protein YncE
MQHGYVKLPPVLRHQNRKGHDMLSKMRLMVPTVRAVFATVVIAGGIMTSLMAFAGNPTSLKTMFVHQRDVSAGPRIDRFDYQTIDPSTGRLFVAGMSIGKLMVFDVRANRLLAELPGFPKVTGVLAVPELHKIYASVPGDGVGGLLSVASGMAGIGSGRGQVVILDSRTLHEIARVPGGVFPNGIAYDPDDRKIFVTDEYGKGLTVIDGDADRTIARVDLPGLVGNVQYDAVTKQIYAAVKTTNELVAINPRTHEVTARYRLEGGRHPHGLAIVPGAGIGFVACDGNDRLLVVALRAGRVLQNIPVAHEPDVLAIDPVLHRLYIAAEPGDLSVLDVTNAAAPVMIATFPVADNAHSVGVDPSSHRVFLPLRNVGGRAVLRIFQPAV